MSTSMVYFGTSYFGRSEEVLRRDYCDGCRQLADLTSYSARRFLVAYFLPVMPLQKVISDECSLCRHHQALEASWTERQPEAELVLALGEFQQQPLNLKKASRLLQVSADYGEAPRFLEVSKEVLKHHGRNADILSLVGEILEEMGYIEQAEAALLLSLEREEVLPRRRLYRLKLRMDRLVEARPC